MSEAESDLYTVLGLSPAASQTEVTAAYRRLVRRHHPDTRPLEQPQHAETARGSDEDLRRVLAAYAVLRDPGRRAAYDRAQRPQPRATAPVVGSPLSARSAPIQAGPVRWHRAARSDPEPADLFEALLGLLQQRPP